LGRTWAVLAWPPPSHDRRAGRLWSTQRAALGQLRGMLRLWVTGAHCSIRRTNSRLRRGITPVAASPAAAVHALPWAWVTLDSFCRRCRSQATRRGVAMFSVMALCRFERTEAASWWPDLAEGRL